MKIPEATEPEREEVPEETPAGNDGEGRPEKSHSSTQSSPEATTDQEKLDAKDELSEKAEQTGINATEKAEEVKENIKDKALPDSPEVHFTPPPRPSFIQF